MEKVKVKVKDKGKAVAFEPDDEDGEEYSIADGDIDDEGEGEEYSDDGEGEEGDEGSDGSHDPALDGSGSEDGEEEGSEGSGGGGKKGKGKGGKKRGRVPMRRAATAREVEETDAAYFLTVNEEKIAAAEDEGGVVGDDEMPVLDGVEAAGDMRRKKNRDIADEMGEFSKYTKQWSEDVSKIVTAHETNHYLGVNERTNLLPYSFITAEVMRDLPNMSVMAVHRLAELVRGHERVMDKTDEVIGGGMATEFAMSMAAHGIEYGAGKEGMALADMEGYAEMMKLRLKTPSAQRMMMRLYRTYWQPLMHRMTGGREGVVSDIMQLGLLFFRGFEDHQVAKRMEAGLPAIQKVPRPRVAGPAVAAPTGAEQMQAVGVSVPPPPQTDTVARGPGMGEVMQRQIEGAAAQAAVTTAVAGGLVDMRDPARLAEWRKEVQLDFSNK